MYDSKVNRNSHKISEHYKIPINRMMFMPLEYLCYIYIYLSFVWKKSYLVLRNIFRLTSWDTSERKNKYNFISYNCGRNYIDTTQVIKRHRTHRRPERGE